ncbi:MAG: RNA polymerase sigma factor [Rhizobiales bacterium]|nr:RNA polymerase sigma factor [Hyphomicrobiales bacterium]
MLPPLKLTHVIEKTVREEWGRILASLTKNLGDMQLAEDCLQEAVISAMNHWQKNGLPKSPPAWLIKVARRKAIDRLRRDQNFASKQNEISYLIELENQKNIEGERDVMQHVIPDKRLEMIFTCCHPALEEKTKIALTLRTLGGLSTQEIANAFLDNPEAMAQRLVRAKKKIAIANIPYEIPDKQALPERLSSVLNVIYLIFNEGYSSNSGDSVTRADLSDEAIRLARIIKNLSPEETEITGLLALMLLHDSRRQARTTSSGEKSGEMISLEDQNRERWDNAKISEGIKLIKAALPKQRLGPYQLQAAISAVHAEAKTWEQTDWAQISALYNLLYAMQPSPVIRINQAMAVSYSQSLQAALTMLMDANEAGKLDKYQPFHAAKADLLSRMGNTTQAKLSFKIAIKLSNNQQEKDFLIQKISH